MKTIIFLVTIALFLQGSLGELTCEHLPVGLCSFSIALSGKRCLLETFRSNDEIVKLFQCKTSEVMAMTNMNEYIESDECVSACGVDRFSIGISSDSLLETQFTYKLCSSRCYDNCPNIIDLYYNLALGEGILLTEMCESLRMSSRRSTIQLQSSSEASAPAAPALSTLSSSVDCAPAPM